MKRILVIDDSLIQLRTINMLLKDKYEVLMSTSGVEGITIAKKERPDLILLDYDMPILSGKETFRKLQEKQETKNIPVLFLTGVDEREDVEKVLKLRPQGYLLKPVENELLFQKIEKILAQHEAKSKVEAESETESEPEVEAESESKAETESEDESKAPDEFDLGFGLDFKTGKK